MSPLHEKLHQLDEYVEQLSSLLHRSPTKEWAEVLELALERAVHKVIGCTADAGDLWLTEHALPMGRSAAEVFRNLQDAGQIDADTYDRFLGYVRSRNKLVHDYGRVTVQDVRRVSEGLIQDIPPLIRSLGSK
jgi:uncharacterized protein YutE (UPF0331/DUF86 family)